MVNKFFLIIFIFLVSFLEATVLNNVKLEDNYLKLYFNKELNKNQLRAFAIPTKDITKYVFDFKNVIKSSKIKYKYSLNGNIKSIRVAQYKNNIVRVVIDSKVKYKLNYSQKENSTFYISLPKNVKLVNLSNEKRDIKIDTSKLFSNLEKDEKSSNNLNLALKDTILKKSMKSKYLIYLDPGHGGKDSGAYVAGVKEKTIVLQIAKRVYRKLKKLGYRVAMTRYGDKFVKLSQRTKKANRAHADIYISIHANSINNKSRKKNVRGLETYFLQKSRTARAKRIAMIENRSLLNTKDKTTRDVLLNAVFTGPKIELSHKLAISVQREILNSVRKSYYLRDNGVDGAPFRVLAGAQTPAVLIETGYLSNSKERKLLTTPDYQEQIANGIVKGITKYFKYRESELN